MKYCGRYGFNEARESRFEQCQQSFKSMIEKAKKSDFHLEASINYFRKHDMEDELEEVLEVEVEKLKEIARRSVEDFWSVIEDCWEKGKNDSADTIFDDLADTF